jgi:aspartate/methionine/tyrosine aminotransferase
MISRRARDITPFIVMEILEKAQELQKNGVNVIHLEIGEPDFDTPQCIKEAACRAIQEGDTHYTHSLGILELRQAICDYYHDTYAVSITPEQIVVTSGTSPAMLLLFSTLLEEDDEVIISDTHYACYANFIHFLKGKPVMVPVHEADGFQLRAASIEKHITSRTKAIFINSPSNPGGTLLSASHMQDIAQLSPHIVSDEIYHGLVYGEKAHSILECSERAFVLNGFSKLFAMTGFRLGYLIAPPEFMRPIQKIQQNFFISANTMAQKAAIVALKKAGDDVEQMRTVYNERRRYMLQRLKKMGFDIPVEPTGAFYIFVNAAHICPDSYRLAFDILEKAHVGVTPGIDFGANGEGYLRFSYANSLENIKTGLDRLENYLNRRIFPQVKHDHQIC